MLLRRVLRGAVVSVLTGCAATAADAAEAPAASAVTASLVAEADAVVPGRPLVVGLRLEMAPGWHTYWRNPGDAGLPTRVRWTLPEGFVAGDLQWPAPERFADGPIVSYGYSGAVVLPVEVRVPPSLARAEVRLALRADWLECREACRPGRADLTLALPVRSAARPGPAAAAFAEARRLLPSARPGWGATATRQGGDILVGIRAGNESPTSAYFFPLEARVVEHGREQAFERTSVRRGRLRLARDPNGPPVERLRGVLVVETARGRRAIAVDVPLPAGAPVRSTRS